MTTDQTTSRQTILDALAQAGVSPEDAAKMIKDAAKSTPRRNSSAAQQLAANKLSKITDKELKDAGITEDEYVSGVRQLLGGASHSIEIPAPFAPRYASDGITTLWGRPRPVRKSNGDAPDSESDSDSSDSSDSADSV